MNRVHAVRFVKPFVIQSARGETMWLQKGYYVYIMSSQRRVLYTGITNDLVERTFQHKAGAVAGFTSKYKATQLVYYESCEDVRNAIRREKEIKGWLREKKIALIERVNPKWKDLSLGWFNRPSDEKLRKMFASLNRMGNASTLQVLRSPSVARLPRAAQDDKS